LLALNPDPLRRVAVVASNKRIKVDKDQIAEEARTVREKVTKGIYKYGPTKLAFDVKSGTLHLAPTTLASPTGVTKINGYVELASLKLDSEWAVSLAGARNQDVPPVTWCSPVLSTRPTPLRLPSTPAQSRATSPCAACRRTSSASRRST
jgi:hypothetical protein